MKVSDVFCRLLPAAILVASPFTTASAMHGGGGGFGGHGFASHSSGSHGFSHFGAHRNFAFWHHGFDRDGRFFRDRDGRFFRDRDDFFFRHRFFVGFDFAAFGFPGWWYPYDDWYPYPDAYYGDPSSYNDEPSSYGSDQTPYGTQYWSNLAISVQTKLAQRGYYHGSIDGVLGSGSQQAIKEFQTAKGMRVTGKIDPKLLKSLGISYKA
jgi:hypothetical protein